METLEHLAQVGAERFGKVIDLSEGEIEIDLNKADISHPAIAHLLANLTSCAVALAFHEKK